MVKFQFHALFPVDHLAHPVVSSLISFCANLLHSLIMWSVVSSLSLHNLYLLFCCVLSILDLIWLIVIAMFCDSVSLVRFTFFRHVHVFSCEILLKTSLKTSIELFFFPFLYSAHYYYLFTYLFIYWLFFCWLLFRQVVWPRFGDPFVYQNPIGVCVSHSQGQMLGCGNSTCSYGQTIIIIIIFIYLFIYLFLSYFLFFVNKNQIINRREFVNLIFQRRFGSVYIPLDV